MEGRENVKDAERKLEGLKRKSGRKKKYGKKKLVKYEVNLEEEKRG